MTPEVTQNLELHRAIFDTIRDALLILDNGVISECNSHSLELFECRRDQLIGADLLRFSPERQNDKTPSSHAFSKKREALEKGESSSFQWTLKQRNGKAFYADITLSRLSPDVSGQSDLTVVQIRDITRRKKAEHDLRRTSAQFRAIFESVPFDLWINDSSNRTFLQNRYSKEFWGDVKGKHFSEVSNSDETVDNWQKVNRIAMEGSISETEISYRRGEELRHYRNIVAPIRDENETIGIVGINIDITEHRKAMEQLKSTLEERETLLKEIHHRVKNNLQIISSIINLKCMDLPLTAKTEWELFHDIENRIDSMALIHEQLYSSTSLTEIKMPLYIRSLVESIRTSFSTIAAEVVIDINFEEISLDVDVAIPLGLILNELVTNSFKHAFSGRGEPDRGGKLEISFHRRGDHYRLILSDDGPGKSTETIPEGMKGLGMVLIEQLTTQLGGSVSFDGAEGFTATMEFPVL